MVSAMATALSTILLLATQAHAKLPLWKWDDSYQAASSGCGISHSTGFNNDTSSHWVLSHGSKRYYGAYVPPGYDPNTPSPLIFDYHGAHADPWEQYDNSQYYATSQGRKYIVIYPLGVQNTWEGASYASSASDDLQFTTDLLAHVRLQYCIDSDHVYASGKSNGAGFVDMLACSANGNEFAAFAMASAALYTDTSEGDCPYKRAILESHGDDDTVIPYKGGNGLGGTLPNIGQWISWWGQRDCGSGVKPVTSKSKGYGTTMYSCNGWQNAVQHYEVASLGHCWPSADGNNYDAQTFGSECQDTVLDFTSVVLNFFAQWDLSNAPGPNL